MPQVEQAIVRAEDMATFLHGYAKENTNINILTVQPYSYSKAKDNYVVHEYLWVFIPIEQQQVQPPPIIIPQVGRN